FPFAALTAAVVPFALLTLRPPRRKDLAVSAETVAAATLALSAVYVALNETLANWQAAWFAPGLIVLAATLASARDAPGSKLADLRPARKGQHCAGPPPWRRRRPRPTSA